MEFLDKETEELLRECVEKEITFPFLLENKFEECKSSIEKQRLRAKLKVLKDNGYITLQWADNVPTLVRIEQKGRSYFPQREIYIRAMLKKDNYFDLLDNESEQILESIHNLNEESFFTIDKSFCTIQVLNVLIEKGYLKVGKQGVSNMSFGDFIASCILTQNGKSYFTDKKKRIEEILLCGYNATSVTNINQEITKGNKFIGYENCSNVVDCKATYVEKGIANSEIINSPIQIQTENSIQNIEYNFQQAEEVLDEIKSKLSDLQLPNDKREELEENIEVAEELIKSKKKAPLKSIMKTIGSIIKDCGVAVVSGLILSKMQGLW